MTTLDFACPACRSALQVAPQQAGTWLRCPQCQQPFQVPAVAPQPALTSSSASISASAATRAFPAAQNPTPFSPPPSPSASGRAPLMSASQDPAIQAEIAQARADAKRAFGRFVILGELGKGGMGAVYRAWDDRLRRVVAIKTLLEESSDDASARARFDREAQAVARLRHPNIINIHEVGEIDRKRYIAMDFIDGASLDKRLGAKPKKKKSAEQAPEKIAFTKALEVLRDVSRAVHHAHEQGVIHRDLKPANIMLDKKDQPFVMDFGLARMKGEGKTRLTRSGAAVGTPAYMPPEQAEGGSGDVDERADVYSLGATLYHVLTGRPPFEGATEVNVITQLMTKDPVPPGALNPRAAGDLETICLRCLEKDPAKRYASAAELADELERYLVGDPIAARPISTFERIVRRARRQKLAAASLAVAVLAVVGLGGLAVKLVIEKRAAEARELENERVLRRDAEKARDEATQAQTRAEQQRKQVEIEKRRADAGKAAAITERDNALREMLKNDLLVTSQATALGQFHDAVEHALDAFGRLRDCHLTDDPVAAAQARVNYFLAKQGPWAAPLVVPLRRGGLGSYSLAWSERGRIAIGHGDGMIELIDIDTRKSRVSATEGPVLRGHRAAVWTVAFDPEGKRLASGSDDSTVRIWDAESGRQIATLGKHQGCVRAVAWSPDGKQLATGDGSALRIFDAQSGAPAFECALCAFDPNNPQQVNSIAWFPEVNDEPPRVVIGCFNQNVYVFDVSTGKGERLQHSHSMELSAVAPSPDGRLVLSASSDQTVVVWERGDDAKWTSYRRPTRAHSGPIYSMAWRADGRRLATSGWDGVAKIWDVERGQLAPKERVKLEAPSEGGVRSAVWGPDARALATLCTLGPLRIWSLGSENVAWIDPPYDPTTDWRREMGEHGISWLAWSPSRALRLATASSDKHVRVWDVERTPAREVASFSTRDDSRMERCYSLAWGPDGRELVFGGHGGSVEGRHMTVWNVDTRERRLTDIEGEEVAWSPDGRWIAAQGRQGKAVTLIDAASGARRSIGTASTAATEVPGVVVFSHDSKRIARNTSTDCIELIDVESGKVIRKVGDSGLRPWLAWSPDDKRVASPWTDGHVQIFDVESASGRPAVDIPAHRNTAATVEWSRDGKLLATGGFDGLVKIWNGEKPDPNHPIAEIAGHAVTVVSLAFGPDGKLASADGNGRVYIWPLPRMLAKPTDLGDVEKALKPDAAPK